MNPNVVKIEECDPDGSDVFFFDCNIWVFLYCPKGDHEKKMSSRYDSFLKRIIYKKSGIVTSSLVISEFVNRYLRFEFELYKDKTGNNNADFKKDFRKSESFAEAYREVKMIVTGPILKIAKPVDDAFSKIGIDDLFRNSADFNDSYYLQLSSMRDYTIVTHDRDFLSVNGDVRIVTGLQV